MRKLILIFLPLFFINVAYSQSKKATTKTKLFTLADAVGNAGIDCKKYKNGFFKIMRAGEFSLIKRISDKQYENTSLSKIPNVFNVKWKNDCTYTLTPTPETIKLKRGFNKNTVLTIEISMQNTKSFTELVSLNSSKGKATNEIYPITEAEYKKLFTQQSNELLLKH